MVLIRPIIDMQHSFTYNNNMNGYKNAGEQTWKTNPVFRQLSPELQAKPVRLRNANRMARSPQPRPGSKWENK